MKQDRRRKKFEIIKNTVRLDPTSPSGLVWNATTDWHKEGEPAGTISGSYWQVSGVRAHRLVYELTTGATLNANQVIDHIDRNGLNNDPANLRPATTAQNCSNKFGQVSDWFPKGVSLGAHGKIVSSVSAGGRRTFVGEIRSHRDHSSEKLNALVAKALKTTLELHGEFACVDSFYCQLPIEAVLGPLEGFP
ncbi:HNH endonuclease [Pseudomonas sp. MPFS]|uniref:HNH endonuclease n=1 Tax=Pseudomonas sp. MPFS TaxID=2795724 RepID=UPI001F12C42A|nr:HNH endonuclease [Pseudomonas sp. MPFS]UMZ14724.1 HNH endonuclease [Pseudomonas sp. MPFS]